MPGATSQPKVLMLIPSVLKRGVDAAVQSDAHPTMDYYALQKELNADILDYGAVESHENPAIVRLARRAGRDVALAMAGYLRGKEYDIIYSNGENVSLPLAALYKGRRVRPGHVLIGHKLSTGKKRILFKALQAQMDTIFVYASTQRDYGLQMLGMPAEKLHLIPFHADAHFYRPMPAGPGGAMPMICSAGLEWRDYPTMLEAINGLNVEVKLAAASPWSKHRNETEQRTLPPNVSARRYEYNELRQLYADSRFVVVPLYENDFQAGITTILEAMAMGKAVITARTTGQIDTIRHGENGLYYPPGDAAALRTEIQRLLDAPELAEQLGRQARRDIENAWSLDHWVSNIATVVRTLHSRRQGSSAA
jgi:glycosyltransferase involved in cell wall biosynthesis